MKGDGLQSWKELMIVNESEPLRLAIEKKLMYTDEKVREPRSFVPPFLLVLSFPSSIHRNTFWQPPPYTLLILIFHLTSTESLLLSHHQSSIITSQTKSLKRPRSPLLIITPRPEPRHGLHMAGGVPHRHRHPRHPQHLDIILLVANRQHIFRINF